MISTRSCGGRRPSSIWPTATPPRAPASVVGSPLAIALAFRGVARCWLGRPGWRQDLDDAVAMARNSDPATHGRCRLLDLRLAIVYGVLRADDAALRAIEEAVQIAERASSDTALIFAEYALGVALLNRDAAADRQRGLEMLVQARDVAARADALPGPGHRGVGRAGRGPGAATAMLPYR